MTVRTTRLAKLTRPALGATFARRRLFELLDQGAGTPALWLSGPPGSGKTTLIADYTARRGIDCLWYQLDRGDSDVASSFYYLAEAARSQVNGIVLPALQPEYLGDVEAFARTFFRELYRQHTPCIVFDNYQDVAQESALQDIVLVAISELPQSGRVFVQSRLDPPPRFAGLRARGQLGVIGWNDLRLSVEECRGMAESRSVQLSDEEVEQLHTRTQGWAAGLVLLLQGMRTRQHPTDARTRVTPSVIFDYVAEEIFAKFPAPVREFLLRAGYLPQLTLPMAEELDPAGDGRSILRELTRSEFLVSVVQAEPQLMVQFHPLLREFLRARAEETGSAADIDRRRRIAARVLAAHGHDEAAAALFIHMAAWDELTRHMAALAEPLLDQGRGQVLQRWILALPAERRDADPWLLYWLGAASFPYSPREGRRLFAEAYARFVAAPAIEMRGVLAALNSAMESIMYDPNDFTLLDPWIEAGMHWSERLSECGSPALEARLTTNMFMAMVLRQPQHPGLPTWRDRAQQLTRTQRDPNALISIHATLVTLSAWVGQLARAEPLLQAMRELIDSPEVSPVSATKFAQAESTYHMLAGDRERCLAAVRRGLDIVAHSGVRLWNDTLLTNGLCGALAEADLDTASEFLRLIEARALSDRKFDVFLHAYGAAWFAVLQGDAFLAHQHLKLAVRIANELGSPLFRVISGIALTQVLFNSGDAHSGQAELERTLAVAGTMRNRLLDFTTLMWRASLAYNAGNTAEGRRLLRAGLEIGRDRALMHFLWWQPQPVAQLCVHALEEGIEPDYVRRLIVHRRLMPDPPPYHLSNWPWPYRIEAFGSFRLVAEGGAVSRLAGRPQELLKVLVALGGARVRLERLADSLWPHVDRDYALRSLNTTLHRLRKSLGDDSALRVEAGDLSLNRQMFWLDTWAFEQTCEAAIARAAQCRQPEQGEALLSASRLALMHYRGPLLNDEPDAAWSAAPRERFRTLLLRMLSAVCPPLEKLGRVEDALDLQRLAAAGDPLAEAPQRRLMLALKQAGRTAEAIEVYQHCRSLLKAELKIEPSAATREVFQSLITQ